MLVKRTPGWAIKESEATPEAVYWSRRNLVKSIAAGPILAAAFGVAPAFADSAGAAASLYPMKRNPRYTLDRPISPENLVETYNNFYEYGSEKDISDRAQQLKIEPWSIKIDGMVEKPMTIGFDALLRKMPLEERLYRHRCVEAWSMAVPWSGFPLKALVEFARPLGSATYIKLVTFQNPAMAPGQREFWYPWPYVEGLTMAEATNDLAFIATGLYGKPMPKQNGAPIRLVVPWKYGFKSVKSVVHVTFTDQRPKTFWAEVGPTEYGFWANVNPEVPHPRWSQATERPLGQDARVPTLIYNGYGEYVAALYKDLKGERLFA